MMMNFLRSKLQIAKQYQAQLPGASPERCYLCSRYQFTVFQQ